MEKSVNVDTFNYTDTRYDTGKLIGSGNMS